jgi:signal transduction histidine kinase
MGVSVGSEQRPELVGSAAADSTALAWEHRWRGLWNALFAATLLVPTVLTLLDGGQPLGWRLATAGIAAAFGVWYAGLVMAHPRWWERPLPMLVYWAGALALFVVLVWRADIYFVLVYGLIPQAFMLLPGRWAYLAAAGVFVLTATAQGGGGALTDPGMLAQLAGNFALASLLGLFINAIARQSEERRRIIVELEQARAENARLLAEARQSAVLQERQRLAGEIHDTLAQGLTGIVTQLEAAEQALDDEHVGVRRHLDTARRLARESLTEARRSVQALRPQPLEAVQLPEAVAQVAARWAHDTGIAATATTTGTPRPLHPQVEVTLLRAAQEALANAARHARPSTVSLTLSYMEDLVSLDVHDDGVGFDPAAPRGNGSPGGFGLTAMGERVARLAGTLEVESAPGQGTTLAVSIPLLPAGGQP